MLRASRQPNNHARQTEGAGQHIEAIRWFKEAMG